MNGFQNFVAGLRNMGAPGNAPRVEQGPAKRVPKRSWQDKAYIIGAGLKDMGGGEGNLDAAREMFGKREEQERIGQIRESLPLEQRALFDVSPEAWARGYGMPQKPEAPAYVEGPDGIYERGESGWTKATSYPGAAPKPPERIEGPDGIYERGEDGQWKKVANFGAAPRVFAPPRVSGGRGGAGGTPTGAPAMSAVEAELKRRGLIK